MVLNDIFISKVFSPHKHTFVLAVYMMTTIFQHLQSPEDTTFSDDYSVCHFPEHRDFVRICRQAEAEAKRSGKKTMYWWRGSRGVVAANLPPITTAGMEVRLLNALSKVTDKTIPETLVNKENFKKN